MYAHTYGRVQGRGWVHPWAGTDRQREGQTEGQIDRKKHRHTYTQIKGQTDREKHRHTHRQKGRQGREKDSKRETHKEHTYKEIDRQNVQHAQHYIHRRYRLLCKTQKIHKFIKKACKPGNSVVSLDHQERDKGDAPNDLLLRHGRNPR